VYTPGYVFGTGGRFAFNKRAYMDETHPLATEKNAEEIFNQWKKYYDLNCKYLIEKSPPNIIRTRFLQSLFQNSKFIVLLRHPLAVSFATKKGSYLPTLLSIIDHTLLAYEILLKDLEYLNSVYVLRYEELTLNPKSVVEDIYNFIGLDAFEIEQEVRTNINQKYFATWENERKHWFTRLIKRVPRSIPVEYEERVKKFGYSFQEYNLLLPAQCLGIHNKK
jgi:hypothetical protein